MNKTQAAPGKNPAKAARLVWLVVLLGLGTGVFTLCAVRAALRNIREQRTRLARVQEAVDQLENELGRGFAEAHGEIQQLLSLQADLGVSGQWFNRMDHSLDSFSGSTKSPEVAGGVRRMKAFLADLSNLQDQAADWNKQYRDCQTAVTEKQKQIEAALLRMRAALSSAEGRQRLDLAVKIRQFRKLSGQPAEDLARQIVTALAPRGDINEFTAEVSTLAMLCERLAGEQEIARLADLKDNLFAASLFRLNSILPRFGATHRDLHDEMEASLGAFSGALLGKGYVVDGDHQTIQPGPGGLYSLCGQRLELRQRRETLRGEMARRTEEYKAAYEPLVAMSDALKDRITSEVEVGLQSWWRSLLIVTGACATVLVVLGNGIAGTIRHQIIAVQAATTELRQSEARTATIIDTAMDAVVTMDDRGKIIAWNPQATAIFGYSGEEAIGQALSELIIPPKYRDAHRAGLAHFLATGEAKVLNQRIEITALRRDGSEFPIELAISVLRAGTSVSFGAFLRDLTDRKKSESENEQMQQELQEVSRRAGMAEVATGVLHNVGNVLNSVNVAASVAAGKLRQSELAGLLKASEMIREHRQDLPEFLARDERGRHLPEFLIEVAGCLGEEQKAVLQELDSLSRGLEHIKHIVGAQQAHAKRGALLQLVSPSEVARTALDMQRESCARHHIRVEHRFSNLPEMPLDKHRVLQVLVNLISNAKKAVRDSGQPEKRITLEVEKAGDVKEKRVRFRVIDNGVGIAAQDLTKIFAHGFTTHEEGHGFGLHSAANAAREMGGSLAAASEGPGKGAIFTLELPIAPSATAQAIGGTSKHLVKS